MDNAVDPISAGQTQAAHRHVVSVGQQSQVAHPGRRVGLVVQIHVELLKVVALHHPNL